MSFIHRKILYKSGEFLHFSFMATVFPEGKVHEAGIGGVSPPFYFTEVSPSEIPP